MPTQIEKAEPLKGTARVFLEQYEINRFAVSTVEKAHSSKVTAAVFNIRKQKPGRSNT